MSSFFQLHERKPIDHYSFCELTDWDVKHFVVISLTRTERLLDRCFVNNKMLTRVSVVISTRTHIVFTTFVRR